MQLLHPGYADTVFNLCTLVQLHYVHLDEPVAMILLRIRRQLYYPVVRCSAELHILSVHLADIYVFVQVRIDVQNAWSARIAAHIRPHSGAVVQRGHEHCAMHVGCATRRGCPCMVQ